MVYVRSMGILGRLLGGGQQTVAGARRPQALAANRGRPALEGLDWLARRPSARAPRFYRLLSALGEAFLYRVCAIHVEVEGREHLPRGGYLAAAALHRGWIDPLVVLRALPVEPRVWFLGSAASVFDRAWKEWLLRRTGGLRWRPSLAYDTAPWIGRVVAVCFVAIWITSGFAYFSGNL